MIGRQSAVSTLPQKTYCITYIHNAKTSPDDPIVPCVPNYESLSTSPHHIQRIIIP